MLVNMRRRAMDRWIALIRPKGIGRMRRSCPWGLACSGQTVPGNCVFSGPNLRGFTGSDDGDCDHPLCNCDNHPFAWLSAPFQTHRGCLRNRIAAGGSECRLEQLMSQRPSASRDRSEPRMAPLSCGAGARPVGAAAFGDPDSTELRGFSSAPGWFLRQTRGLQLPCLGGAPFRPGSGVPADHKGAPSPSAPISVLSVSGFGGFAKP